MSDFEHEMTGRLIHQMRRASLAMICTPASVTARQLQTWGNLMEQAAKRLESLDEASPAPNQEPSIPANQK